jgi:signal transduction histidine kinase
MSKKLQIATAVISITALITLGLSSLIEAHMAESRSRILSNVETPAASIIFTQRETLVYSTRLALWSNGGTSRREVQIARALLAQRLSVVDSSGRTMGSRANESYWRAIRHSDEIVASAPSGILPESMHSELNRVLIPIIDEIVSSARELVVSYQRSVDAEMEATARETSRRDALNLTLLYIFVISGALFLLIYTRGNVRNFAEARAKIHEERLALEETLLKLKEAERRVDLLEDLDAAKDSLISNVNHELRTPLTSIIGYIELLQRTNPARWNEEENLYLSILQRNAEVLLKLVESLLSLSKFDSAEGKIPDEPVYLNEVLESAIFTLWPATEKAQISISTDIKDDYFLRGDVAQLNQLLINLIANAVKFSNHGGAISIKVFENRDLDIPSVSIVITDNGIGISPSDLPSIFDRFFRGNNFDGEKYSGSGLGLAIAHHIALSHHGFIDVQSNLGEGSTFTLTLPLFRREEQ